MALTPPGIASSSAEGNPSLLSPPNHCELQPRSHEASAVRPEVGQREKWRHSISGLVQEELPQEKLLRACSLRNQTTAGSRKLTSLPVTFGPTSASLQTASGTFSVGANDL